MRVGVSGTCLDEDGEKKSSSTNDTKRTGQQAGTHILSGGNSQTKWEVKPITLGFQERGKTTEQHKHRRKEATKGRPVQRLSPDPQANSSGRCDLEAGRNRLRRASVNCAPAVDPCSVRFS